MKANSACVYLPYTCRPVRSDEGEESDDMRRKVPKLKLQVTAEGKIKGQRSRQSSSSAFESQR